MVSIWVGSSPYPNGFPLVWASMAASPAVNLPAYGGENAPGAKQSFWYTRHSRPGGLVRMAFKA
jgi:hypothetical protein